MRPGKNIIVRDTPMRTLVLYCLIFSIIALGFAQNSRIKFYGYFDLEGEVSNKDAQAKNFTFDQHHLNFISIYRLPKNFRLFTEMEWEHGATIEADGPSTGKIYLTRAWLEMMLSDKLKFQFGKILVPFGIYGIMYDATPTYLSTKLPPSLYGKHENSVGDTTLLYAKYLTGIQSTGTLYLRSWEFTYYLYFTNGRGPNPDQRDNNANKGIGGRIILNPPFEPLQLGLSYYQDKNGNAYNTDQRALAFDLDLDFPRFDLETEYIITKGEKVDENKRPNGTFIRQSGYYIQLSYTMKDRFIPFVRYDYFDPRKSMDGDGTVVQSYGLNITITSQVYFKNELHFHRFGDPKLDPYEIYLTSIAVAF